MAGGPKVPPAVVRAALRRGLGVCSAGRETAAPLVGGGRHHVEWVKCGQTSVLLKRDSGGCRARVRCLFSFPVRRFTGTDLVARFPASQGV